MGELPNFMGPEGSLCLRPFGKGDPYGKEVNYLCHMLLKAYEADAQSMQSIVGGPTSIHLLEDGYRFVRDNGADYDSSDEEQTLADLLKESSSMLAS